MIIARLTDKSGKSLFHGSVEIVGSPVGESYRVGGWFPVESFDFGVQDKDDKSEEKSDSTKPAQRTLGQSSATPVAKGGKSSGKGNKDGPTVTLQKQADMATTELMVLAMQELSKKAAKKRDSERGSLKELRADIHVLGSVAYEDSKERFVYPSLMIHLEAVRVTNWKINCSGNSRPTENVTLQYERSAMIYTWTDDGKQFFPSKAAGWDQDKHERWPSAGGDQFIKASSAPDFFKDYLPSIG